jgi:hypothetical protein
MVIQALVQRRVCPAGACVSRNLRRRSDDFGRDSASAGHSRLASSASPAADTDNMPETINIYCDESCHLENDRQPVMVLGAVWCSQGKTREIAARLREIKVAHGLLPTFEIKWTKVSPSKLDFYLAVLNCFFEENDLHFRALVAHKAELRHADFGQSHDDWYYKMMFGLMEPLLKPDACFRIYLDKKDTRSAQKVVKLHDVLCNNLYDFNRTIVERVQVVESHAVEQLQLADLLIGAVGYVNRGLNTSVAKVTLVNHLRQRTGYTLERSTLLRESKLNLFVWRGQTGAAQ